MKEVNAISICENVNCKPNNFQIDYYSLSIITLIYITISSTDSCRPKNCLHNVINQIFISIAVLARQTSRHPIEIKRLYPTLC